MAPKWKRAMDRPGWPDEFVKKIGPKVAARHIFVKFNTPFYLWKKVPIKSALPLQFRKKLPIVNKAKVHPIWSPCSCIGRVTGWVCEKIAQNIFVHFWTFCHNWCITLIVEKGALKCGPLV
jgi:hypothetical protein